MDFKGKTALITGGGRGIGAAIALKLAEYGCNIAVCDFDCMSEAELVINRVKEFGKKGLALKADVSDFNEAQKVVSSVITEFNGFEILICNAGINRDGVIWKMDENQWDDVINVNLKGCFNFIRAASPLFREQKQGKIVNISSINGLRGKFGQANYAASKAGIIGLTKSTAIELGKYNINVNAVAPGFIETEMVLKLPENVVTQAMQEITLGRIGRPEEVAEVVSFLCSEKARHITGEIIKVDGGQYI